MAVLAMTNIQNLSCAGAGAALVWCLASAASQAQEVTFTPAPEVSALMSACTPISAMGPDVRDTLMERGWAEFSPEERLEGVQALSAALLWSILPNSAQSERIERFDAVTDAVQRAADGETASLLQFGDQIAMLLWNGDNLSCVWAGPQTEAVDTLAVQIGGFPESDGVMTAALNQTVEAGGRDWARRMSLARTPVADLPAQVAGQAITDAARLDRSPS
jgi:hypothetical protein